MNSKFFECATCGQFHAVKTYGKPCHGILEQFTEPQIDDLRDRLSATGSRRTITVDYLPVVNSEGVFTL